MATALAVEQAAVVLGPEQGERLTYRGVEIVFKSPAGSAEGWTVLDYTMAPRQFGAPLHYHRDLTESFYVLSGKLWLRAGDQEIDGGPGTFVLVPPGVLHSFANRTDEPARFLCHASNRNHKTFLTELFHLATTLPSWPPSDPGEIIRLGERYDTVYVL